MTKYIDEHRDTFGVEPICQVLAIAPSTYYAARTRPPSKRSLEDEKLRARISKVHKGNFEVYGVRKVWRQLRREDVEVGRDHVGRLMAELGLCGVTRTKKVRTTTPAAESDRPADLVDRVFTADAPDRLWVADLTYVWTRGGFCYTAFIIDAFIRRIVGWRVSSSLRTDLALDALEMAIFSRGGGDLDGLVHHSDRGSQGGFNWSSQHCLVRGSVGVRRGPRRGSSSQGSCGACCSELRRPRPDRLESAG